ncbi:hypothetical protein M4D48_08455 [Alkalihalobacillus clausii]|uniref:CdiA C-terminal domain-containing protein n=1 Tax=Shouchella clausii TaxID=79880 RepID=UPI0020426C2B|nr:hypothetical protein [Shouchella clausii]MCM3548605.1 hypothetical protein [Shouchella clausii]
MGATHAVTPAYFPLFARLSTLPANATVSPAILTRQLKKLVPIQYQWYQAQLRTQAIQTDTSQVVTTPGYMFTDQEVAAINTYLENNPPNEERLNENPVVAGVVDFFFGDFLTLADPETSLGEKALATTFILVKPAKVGEVVYDLSKARKVKTGGKGKGNLIGKLDGLTSAERKVVDDLLANGKKVEIIPTSTQSGVKTPDFLVNGVKTELKTLKNPNINTGVTRIQKGLKQGAETVIIDGRQAGLTTEQARQIINRATGTYSDNKIPGKIEIWTNAGLITYP